MENLDNKIDEVFSQLCEWGGFKFNQENESFYIANKRYFNVLVSQHKLISQTLGRDMFLTDFGKKVCKRGGWLKHLDNEEKLERRREQKEAFDFQTAKWKYYTFWWWFVLAILGGGYSVYDIIERLSTTEMNNQGQISTTTSTESGLEKQESQSTLILDQKHLDSLRNSKNRADTLNTQ